MRREVTATGKDIDEARENARAALGAGELDDVTFNVVDFGMKGIFGIGSRPAMVRASLEIPDPTPRAERQKEDRPHPKNEGGDKPRQNQPNRNQNRNQGQKKPKPAPKQPAFVPEPKKSDKPAAVPEALLTFTPLSVADGEDRSLDLVRTVLRDLGVNATAEMFACDDGTRRISVTGEEASILIGHHGETLDALQYLANLALSRGSEKAEHTRVTLDVEGYRAKREATLRKLARSKAERALRTHRNVTLEPMSAYERRIIHSEVQGIAGVCTNSIGSDSNRRVVIYLTDDAPVAEEAPVEQAQDD